MKCTFSQLCCGLLCLAGFLSLGERLRAEDAPDSEGIVRTINVQAETNDTGVTQTQNEREVPNDVNREVDTVFRRVPTRRVLRPARGPKWNAYTSWSFKPGNERIMGDGQVMVPLWQNNTSMLFADVRGQIDDSGSHEGNWGLGFRQIRDESWIFGLYGFYDRRKTETGNYFSQGTFGIEALTVEWEARANVYLPDSRPLTINRPGAPPQALIFNGRAIIRHGGTSLEQALYGVDVEVGKLFYEWGRDVELRGFVSAFHFDTENQGFANVSGGRVRSELRMYDVDMLGEGSRVNLGAELQWDELRDTQATAMLRVQIPLGRRQQNHSRLERRMLDRVVRDVDIVSSSKSQPGFDEEAIDFLTGRSFGNIVVIEGATVNPDVVVNANAVAAAGGPSTVIVSNRSGQLNTNATITLGQFQNLIGSGYTQAVTGAITGTRLDLNIAGSIPTIDSSASTTAINTVTLADDTTVRGIRFTGAGINGVSGAAVERVVIDSNEFLGSASSGLRVTTSFSGNVTRNFADSNGVDGLWIDSLDPDGLFNGVLGGVFANNLTTNNGADGIHTNFINPGTFLINNESNNNGGAGYFTFAGGGTAFNNIGFGNGNSNTFP